AVSIEREIVQDLSDLVVGSVTFGSSPLEFEKLKTLVLNRGDAACKALGIPLLFSKPDPMPWIHTAFVRERDRYAKHEAFTASTVKATPKKEATASAMLSFDADF
ncbi:hypothetical protein HDV03_002757, partial [Kappamyces sp. JEL0829]